MPFMAAEMSVVAAAFRSVGVISGAALRFSNFVTVLFVGFSVLGMVKAFKKKVDLDEYTIYLILKTQSVRYLT